VQHRRGCHGLRRALHGADEGVERLGLSITDTVFVHVRVAAAFVVLLAIVSGSAAALW